MKHRASLRQNMVQKMALSPRMKLSLRLLGMPAAELNEYINAILEKNPLLKKEFEYKKPAVLTSAVDIKTEFQIKAEDNPRLSLISQLRMRNLDKKDMEIAEYLIYEMDDNGYIKIKVELTARDLLVDAENVENVLSIIQSMEPAGIGARDVSECLQLQLERKGKEKSLEYAIVTDYINELAVNNAEKISKELNRDKEDVKNAMENIKKLNPRPCGTLLSKEAKPVIPDMLAFIKNHKISLELNREWVPRLKFYNPYEGKVSIVKDPKAREFIKENRDAAMDLIDSLKRREETMCRVTDYIMNHQKDYVEDNAKPIKSLTLNEVAEALELHASTISRTLANKYVQVNDKVIALKTLLSHGLKKENGETISKTAIKSRIKEIVDQENKAKPMSDTEIMKKLEEEGIFIKRRTTAKYRESLRLLPTHLRKRK